MELIEDYTKRVMKGELLNKEEIILICEQAKELFKCESNILNIKGPVNVIGDLRGQFKDLLEIFKVAGEPGEINFVFLGNYIGVGGNSIDIFILLVLHKIKYSNKVLLLRGIHECKNMSSGEMLADECIRKYQDQGIWNIFVELFNYLPLACIIENSIFCVHSGLSPFITTVDEINQLDRFIEIPNEGPIYHLLSTLPEAIENEWQLAPESYNILFGEKATENFNSINKISLIVRSHQGVMEGFQLMHNEKLVSIFSASNYCEKFLNFGAVLQIDENLNKNYIIYKI